jgi:pimeloyl-ACP methyl ester carboxylesterase
MKKLFFFLVLTSFLFSNKFYSQPKIEGSWSGKIEIMGMALSIEVRFKQDTDSLRAEMDITEQTAKDVKLNHVQYNYPSLHFEMPAGPSTAFFDGIFEGDTVKGSIKQAGMEGKFYLASGKLKEIVRDTMAPEEKPYKSEEVTFTNGENTFAGTLTIPFNKGKHPAVIMITGSGAQNRDEELFGFKPFAIIADYFTTRGIAVLRYDDRGFGESKGKKVSESTTHDFAEDVIEAVKYLQSRDDINPKRIGLCGHSEGGIIAPLVASMNDDIAFIVLIAGTSVKGIDIIQEQSKLIMKANNSPDSEIEKSQQLYSKLYQSIVTDTGWNELKLAIKDLILAETKSETDSAKTANEKNAEEMAEMQMKGLSSNWFKYFLVYDPYPALTKVKCPVLALFGELDLQVPPSQNKGPMEEALSKSGTQDYKIIVMPKANHLFQSAVTGSPTEYGSLPKEFVPEFLDTMSGWILEHVTIVK